MAVKELNEKNFDSEVGKGKVIVDFFAPWCGPCKMMGPVFEELSSEIDSSEVKFAKVNTEEHPNLAQRYAIMSIPCFVVFNDGEEVERIIGGMSKEDLKERIESI